MDVTIAPDFVDHTPHAAAWPGAWRRGGQAGLHRVPHRLSRPAHHLRSTVDDLIAEGDQVVARLTVRDTNQGAFMGMPATGKLVTITAIDRVRVAGGKLAECWAQSDRLGRLQQLGAIPAPGAPGPATQ